MSKLPPNESKFCATIFGAGVAGLTVAHELVERNFRVQIWEPFTDERMPSRGCDVGGLARTQWSRAHWPEKVVPGAEPTPRVGRLPVELWWTKRGFYGLDETATPRPPSPDLVDEVIRTIADRTALEESEARVHVYVRFPIHQRSYSVDAEFEEKSKTEFLDAFRTVVEDAGVFAKVVLETTETEAPCLLCDRDGRSRVRLDLVFRPEEPTRVGNLPGVKARLQFYFLPAWGVETEPIETFAQKFYIKRTPKDPKLIVLGREGSEKDEEVVHEILDALEQTPNVEQLYVEVYDKKWSRSNTAYSDRDFREWDLKLAEWIRKKIEEAANKHAKAREQLGAYERDPDPTFPQVAVHSRENQRRARPGLPEHLRRDGTEAENPPDSVASAGGSVTDVSVLPYSIGMIYGDKTSDRLDLSLRLRNGRLVDIVAVRLDELPLGAPDDVDVIMQLRVRERWFPGEHGYRYFPSFYWHLFDTMKRTPILDPVPKNPVGAAQERSMSVNADLYRYVESGFTAFDNLVPRPAIIDAFTKRKRPAVVSRYPAKSITELVEESQLLFGDAKDGGFGFTPRDAGRYMLKSLQFLTACDARRSEYEEISWWKFIDGDSYGDAAANSIANFPRALVAMDPKRSDARTIGSVGAQLVLDQARPDGARDGALNGPTGPAWLDHWRRYLEAQGVEFIHGELIGLDVVDGDTDTKRIWPRVRCYEPRYLQVEKGRGKGSKNTALTPALMPGYFVLSLPVQKLQQIARRFCDAHPDVHHPDLEAVTEIPLGDVNAENPSGELQNFAGIQFYFWEDLYWIDGHVYFPDSPWGLTSISQTRRWADRPDWEHGYRGVLSIIIGEWDTVGGGIAKKARDCSPEEIAKEAWAQVRAGLDRAKDQTVTSKELPQPVFWHLDENFRFDGERLTNSIGFQIQSPGHWKSRPGDLGERGYSTKYGVALAGTYMKTHTRITSMEAANESGRHAVNAILRDCASRLRSSECDIWTMEERELDDLKYLKELDARLHARKVPHFIDVLGLDYLSRELLSGGSGDPLNPTWLLRKLAHLAATGDFEPFERA